MALRARTSLVVALGIAVAGLALLRPPPARACGTFFPRASVARPSLARETVLLIHGAADGREHLIREVAFRGADAPFGFVVPIPTRPEVASVQHSPFDALRGRFSYLPPPPLDPIGLVGCGGRCGSDPDPGVEVLEVKRVGSFTAFVLAATDEAGLATWLTQNELVGAPESVAWLAHYVAMDFFFVAMRFNAPAKGSHRAVHAETMRISFATPVPYYPYLEPARPGEDARGPRLLEIWYVGREPVVPVALRDVPDRRMWVQPLSAGEEHTIDDASVELALGPELEAFLPARPLVVQTFQDQKRTRPEFGDILFAHRNEHVFDDAERAALEPLLAVLDPALVGEAK